LLPMWSSQVRLSFFVAAFFVTFLALSGSLPVASTFGLVLTPTNTSWLRNSSLADTSPVRASYFRFKALGRCMIRNL
nr:hypothetical protein [Tanacetum cinerariifolium]